ncbi:MAG: DUF2239 family protein [Desulfobacterales bacterium]|nr:DUF2239 family protein [Desulfobacterales bacterium]
MKPCTAFEGSRCIASGNLETVVRDVKAVIDQFPQSSLLIFDDLTAEIVEVDFRGTAEDVVKRLEKAEIESGAGAPPEIPTPNRRPGPGRPKLGVVSREITLLPRHWDWLNSQPGGASVTLRKLVEKARLANGGQEMVRRAQEASYRFMAAMAGDRPGFEEATRALFAGNPDGFKNLIDSWPADIRDHARKLSQGAFPDRKHADQSATAPP